LGTLSFAQQDLNHHVLAADNDSSSDELYYIEEQLPMTLHSRGVQQMLPLHSMQNLFSDIPETIVELKARALSLVHFTLKRGGFGQDFEPYNRNKHFGGWVNNKRDDNCYNTRAKVLIRDSVSEVTFGKNHCVVASGSWEEPYAGVNHHEASEVQIDHFVPLKNAYISGAFNWDFSRRCLYANFLGNDFHLISVDGRENQRKSDKTPEGYTPPNQRYVFQYLSQWLKVKLIWRLALRPSEKMKLIELIKDYNCRASDFAYSEQELKEQRQFIDENLNLCE
jgi:hypothetical protein